MIWLNIDKNKNIPLTKQIYKQIRDKILNGELSVDTKLPSSRNLSEHLHISRNVVLEAYHLLLLEGYIITKPSLGTFVAEVPRHTTYLQAPASSLSTLDDSTSAKQVIDFRSGIPALDLLPNKKWHQLYAQKLFNLPPSAMGYGLSQGTLELRYAICDYLQRTRGITCEPSQIIITNSSIQSFSILSHVLLKENPCYIVEDPLHNDIRQTFSTVSNNYHIVPSDKQGILTSLLPQHITPAFIFVTPSHQYPLGGLLSAQRRIELIQYATEKNCYIIEDDYDSEFHYKTPPLSTLYDLSPKHVIYIGTFSKVLCPTLRIGYMIVPLELTDKVCTYKKRCDFFTHTISQLVLSDFINGKHLEKHINKMQKIYLKRRNTLINALKQSFGDSVCIEGDATGLHLIASFKNVIFTSELIDFLYTKGIQIHPIWYHSKQQDYPKNSIILGYSHLSPETITAGIAILKEYLSH
ncbi:MocR-like pyridoxine biosynthesis transcription factor PdxR [Cellulosilyticum ruminicola]|uniref:MocR-like pyridoxine biosynthesis transcription factor PdxR n=1 Tax=Cellulosilyticum ruminicola TaxID=425254 RepID=UPI0006D0FDCE|nr:PLP-dependent aminotransferase family protein [Cellulosilyticum ruminicola]